MGLRRSLDGVNVTQGTSNVNDSWKEKRYTLLTKSLFMDAKKGVLSEAIWFLFAFDDI